VEAGHAVIAALALLTFAPDQDWVAGGVSNGVAVSFRDNTAAQAREVRAVAELPHAADGIVALVCDFTQPLDPDVREAELLTGDLASRYEISLSYASRFLVVAPREVVIDVRRQPGGCDWSDVPDRMTARSGMVRMEMLRGSWSVEPLDASRSRVTYQIAVKPGGRMPGWLVRRGAASALPDVIARVGRKLANR